MNSIKGYDFCGWATRNDVLCADGRTIRSGAFEADDGKKVPLIWGHQHDSPETVLGHGILENRPEGVYVYGFFNDSPLAQYSKTAVEHGDITSLSIWANHFKQNGGDVLHGSIKEVSLVLAGANQKACIEYPYIAHGDDIEENMDEAYIYMGEEFTLTHGDAEEAKTEETVKEEKKTEAESTPDAEVEEGDKEMEKEETKSKSIGEIFEEMTDEQKMAVAAMIGYVKENPDVVEPEEAEEAEKADEKEETKEQNMKHEEGDTTMQYNAFDMPAKSAGTYLSHADEEAIIGNGKKLGSLKKALEAYAEENSLQHEDETPAFAAVSGFTSYPDGSTPAGVDALFPEYRNVRPGAPELVTNDQTWVKAVLTKVHKSPFSRIRTNSVDVREIEEIRARGYAKGKEKVLAGNYAVAKRATDPQTVYVKSALNRDDIIDITDFDYVDYQYKIDRMQLELELARAILIGDGRDAASPDKISPDHIRPIWGDAALYTIAKPLTLAQGTDFGTNYLYASAMEEALLDAKIDYRGTGAADMFCSQEFFNKILLAKDLNGRRIYKDKNEVAAALDVANVYNVPEFANKTRTVTDGSTTKTMKLLAIIGNLADYALGATKGGEITHFTQFDIDFNQEKSLLETRCSGATTKIYSFIVIEEEVA